VLVGNKCDLESDRVISYEKGESLGKDLGCCFLESSALLKKNVNEIFDTIVKECKRIRIKNNQNNEKETKEKRARRPRCIIL